MSREKISPAITVNVGQRRYTHAMKKPSNESVLHTMGQPLQGELEIEFANGKCKDFDFRFSLEH